MSHISPQALPHITVLMGVLNGAHFLEEQLCSLATQIHQNWSLTCSDDGSTDTSTQVINRFRHQTNAAIQQTLGPQTGFSDNYMSLIRALPNQPGYVAFADQDDIWADNKLSRGLAMLRNAGDTPALYCARRWIWHPDTGRTTASADHELPFDFKNALIENIASGNTILLNPAAAALARRAAQRTGHVFAHDWWLYLLISGTGGKIIFDHGSPRIHYRQHAQNAIGAGIGAKAAAQRKLAVLQGEFAGRINDNIAAMQAVRALLLPHARTTLDAFAQARQASLPNRLRDLYRIAPYRQTRLATLGFWGAASVGRI